MLGMTLEVKLIDLTFLLFSITSNRVPVDCCPDLFLNSLILNNGKNRIYCNGCIVTKGRCSSSSHFRIIEC